MRVHKAAIGGVPLNLTDEQAVRKVVDSMKMRLVETIQLDAMEGMLVQSMVTSGVEVMIRVTDDPLFGR